MSTDKGVDETGKSDDGAGNGNDSTGKSHNNTVKDESLTDKGLKEQNDRGNGDDGRANGNDGRAKGGDNTGNGDDGTGNGDDGTGKGDDDTGNGDNGTSKGDDNTGNGDDGTDNGDDGTGNGDDDTGKGGDNTGNGDDGTGNGDDDTGKGDDGTGNGDEGTDNGDDGTGNGDDGTGKGDDNTGKGDDDTGNGDDDTGNGDDGTGNGDDGTGKGGDGTGNGDDGTGKGGDGTSKGDDDTGNGDDSTGNGDDNTGNGDDETGNGGDGTGTGDDNTGKGDNDTGNCDDGTGNSDDCRGNGKGLKEENDRSVADDSKVLIYDAENGCSKTTRDFIDALQEHLHVPMWKFKDFQEAHDEQRDCLYIIAVVRHTTPRIGETFNEVKAQLHKENVKDLRRVIVTYFYATQPEDDLPNKIENISKSDTYACIHLFDFIDTKLVVRKKRPHFFKKESLKKNNKTALQRIKTYMQENFKTEWSVNVFYYLEISPLVKQFLSELRPAISNSIQLQQGQPLKAPINVTSPTLIFIAECGNDCLENLIKEDLKKVIIIKIIDFENSTTSQATQGRYYGQTWEIINYKGDLKADLKFPKCFENFVRTWTT